MNGNHKYINLFAIIAFMVVVANVMLIFVLYRHLPAQIPIAFSTGNATEPQLHHKISLFLFPLIALLVDGFIYLIATHPQLRSHNAKYFHPVRTRFIKMLFKNQNSMRKYPYSRFLDSSTARNVRTEEIMLGITCLFCAVALLLVTLDSLYPQKQAAFKLIQTIFLSLFICVILRMYWLAYHPIRKKDE